MMLMFFNDLHVLDDLDDLDDLDVLDVLDLLDLLDLAKVCSEKISLIEIHCRIAMVKRFSIHHI